MATTIEFNRGELRGQMLLEVGGIAGRGEEGAASFSSRVASGDLKLAGAL